MPVCHYLVSPGSGTESVFVFVGCIDSTKIEGVHGVETEGEDIRTFTVPLQEYKKLTTPLPAARSITA